MQLFSKNTSLSRCRFKSSILVKFGSVQKNIRPVFFLSAMVERASMILRGCETSLKIGGAKYILLNISEIIKDIVFAYIGEICVF